MKIASGGDITATPIQRWTPAVNTVKITITHCKGPNLFAVVTMPSWEATRTAMNDDTLPHLAGDGNSCILHPVQLDSKQ
jgi:hypothetical protein